MDSIKRECDACSGELWDQTVRGVLVLECRTCGGVHYEGPLDTALSIVDWRARMVEGNPETDRYFSIQWLDWPRHRGSIHGWFDPATGCMTQEG